MREVSNVALAWIGGIVAIIVLIIVCAALGVFSAGVQAEVDKAANSSRETSILFQPGNSIGTYEEFYQKCNSVKQDGEKIAAAEIDLKAREAAYDPKSDSFGDGRKEISTLRSQILGMKNLRAEKAGEYNAKSSQTTSAQFKAADLPHTLEEPYTNIDCGTAKPAGR